jgi:primosomal protein N' (replication factor Y)
MQKTPYIKVYTPLPFDDAFDYEVPEGMNFAVNDYVQVPFRGKKLWGIVAEINVLVEEKIRSKIKKVVQPLQVDNKPINLGVSKEFLEFLKWQANYYIEPLGEVLKLSLPQAKAFDAVARKKQIKITKITDAAQLNQAQQKVFDNIQARIDTKKFSTSLIDGITGSGKTEVYFKAIENLIAQGFQALVLLPEIMLTNQVFERFQARLGITPCVWHSGITPAQRRDNWLLAASGEGKVFIGARSALFLPYKNLKIIVVDEEHDASFKQEDGVVYNARDMAVMRSKFEDISTILVSATPSIETFINANNGKFEIEKLHERHGNAILPEINIVDMRQENLPYTDFISGELKTEIKKCLENKKQALMFLNRRGYAPLTLCGKCGYRFKSPDTSTWLVQHHAQNGDVWLECHHTGYRIKMPDTCPECKEKNSFRSCGPGVQRIAEEIIKNFSQARVEVITSDTISTPKKAAETIRRIEMGEVDVIIGTQMIAKGHNFPALTLVGVIDGDLGLEGADIRASERCFQMLQQVSGRAGRADDKGKVLIQTYAPEHPVMLALKENNRDKFYNYEINNRKNSSLPPFSKLAAIILTSKSEAECMRAAKAVVSVLAQNAANSDAVKIYGPVNALVYVLRNNYRNRILIKAERNFNLQKFISNSLKNLKLPNIIKLKVDIDPYSFM